MPRGLANANGQNNCFLNVVVQSLWHLDAFRVRFGGAGNVASGAWGKKPQVSKYAAPLSRVMMIFCMLIFNTNGTNKSGHSGIHKRRVLFACAKAYFGLDNSLWT